MAGYRHFKVIVAGDNPEELMLKYDDSIKGEPRVAYEFDKAGEYKSQYLKYLKEALEYLKKEGVEETAKMYEDEISLIEEMNDEDYFAEMTEGFEIDKETGNAMTRDNINGRFAVHNIGGRFSAPFVLKGKDSPEEEEVYSAKKGDIDWGRMHLYNRYPYEVAWDTTHGIRKPENDAEKEIYDNMKNLTAYFANFKDREHYIASNTAFWGLAFVDENDWYELGDGDDQFDWVIGFYDRFIKPLPDDTLLTIYECVRN